MDERPVEKNALLSTLPPPLDPGIAAEILPLVARVGRKVVALDDDPTGTQTVHDVPVLTRWSADALARELRDPSPVVYLLTNSRSLPVEESVRLHRSLAADLRAASRATGRDTTIISRSDSTLRGHFPAELDAIEEGLAAPPAPRILAPFFEEGGRLTIGDVHWVAEGSRLLPAARTPFAADPAFGYRSSNLREWVSEKTGGRIPANAVRSLSIHDARRGGPDALLETILAGEPGSVTIVNAATRSDLDAATVALLRAEARGRRLLYRSAASLVAARSGISPRPLLAREELLGASEGRGILVVVGSWVPRTSAQLARLVESQDVAHHELDAAGLLDDSRRESIVRQASRAATRALEAGKTAVLSTTRRRVGGDSERSLEVGRVVSGAIVATVRAIRQRPSVIIAKGGITSSDIATDACKIERAVVAGQILPGVPVWRCGPESRFPNLPLVIFPGNVGDDEALVRAVERSRSR